ncbi:MAG: Rieske 2Fe-2S domain-containing protein [Cyanobacteria bacterium J06627_3]
MKDWKNAPCDGASRFENQLSQPLKTHRVFNNPQVLTQGWYPTLKSSALKPGTACSHKILNQRLVLYRGQDGTVRSMDAFCPHMGADLGNGTVIDNRLRCYFHHWEFNGDGSNAHVPTLSTRCDVRQQAYPVEEKYGFIWVFAGPTATHPVPVAPGLESTGADAFYLEEITLFVHHHILMANGIDLNHFAAVHHLTVAFNFEVTEKNSEYVWEMEGKLPHQGLKARLGRWLLGDTFRYRVKISGGSVATITYGHRQQFRGSGRPLPSLHLLWGATPQPSGISKVKLFLLTQKRRGVWGKVVNLCLYGLTLALLTMIQDEDIKAFPNMRFTTGHLVKGDESIARFVQCLNQLPLSNWTGGGWHESHIEPRSNV